QSGKLFGGNLASSRSICFKGVSTESWSRHGRRKKPELRVSLLCSGLPLARTLHEPSQYQKSEFLRMRHPSHATSGDASPLPCLSSNGQKFSLCCLDKGMHSQ